METVDEYLQTISAPEHRETMQGLLERIQQVFPGLALQIKWNQPMFIDHGSFIIGFSAASKHYTVAPEKPVLDEFREQIVEAGYSDSKMLFRITWEQDVDWDLMSDIIHRSIEFKQHSETFWAQ